MFLIELKGETRDGRLNMGICDVMTCYHPTTC